MTGTVWLSLRAALVVTHSDTQCSPHASSRGTHTHAPLSPLLSECSLTSCGHLSMQARCQKWASVESWRPEYTLIFCASASPPVHRTAITSRSPLLIISIVIAALQHLRVAEALRVALLPRAAPHDLHLGVGVGRGGGGCAHFALEFIREQTNTTLYLRTRIFFAMTGEADGGEIR
jgi:hypothetical protein